MRMSVRYSLFMLISLPCLTFIPQSHAQSVVSAKSGAENVMQQQFLFLMNSIGDQIDPAISAVKEDLEASNIRKLSYGWALVAGGAGDSLADYVGNNRQPIDLFTTPEVVYSYGYNLGYGFGFGGPFLLPTYLADTDFTCSSDDFFRLVNDYQYEFGVPQRVGSTELTNFGYDAKQSLHCLLQHSGDYAEAANIEYLIDDMVEAGQAVINLRS